MANIPALVEEFAPHAIEIRRELHAHPELANQEVHTTELIRRELRDYGITEIQELPGVDTGLVALIRGAKPGKTVGIREDIDALPMREMTGLPFASTCDAAHSCGHDIHCSILLLIARVLQTVREELCGNVRLIFQPAEEEIKGAQQMIRAGLFELEPKCDTLIGCHCSPEFDGGSIGVRALAANASTDAVTIVVKGQGGHGAHPYRCVDPVTTAAYMLTQLQTLISRENPAVQPAVLTFGTIHGGTACNVIPTEVTLTGTLRSFDPEGREKLKAGIVRIAENSCAAMRAKAEVSFGLGCPPVINDPEVIERIRAAAAKTIGADHVCDIPVPSTGSDDIGYMIEKLPGAQFRVGTGNDDPNSRRGLHNPMNIFDEKAIATASAVIAQFVMDYSA